MSSRQGRPLAFDRDAALDALQLLFWEMGYAATSQAEMARRTGLSTSSLYNTFGNKPEIFDAVLTRYGQRTARLLATLRDGTNGLDDVQAFFTALAEQLRASETPRGCLMVNTMLEPAGQQPGAAAHAAAYRDQVKAALTGALERAVERGEIRKSGLHRKAALLLGLYLGVMATARADAPLALEMIDSARGLLDAWGLGLG